MWLFELLTGYELSAQLPSWAPNWSHTSLTGVWDSQVRYQAGGRNFAAPEFVGGGKTMKIALVRFPIIRRDKLYDQNRRPDSSQLLFGSTEARTPRKLVEHHSRV